MENVMVEKSFKTVLVQTDALKMPAPIVQVKEVVMPDPEMEA